MAISSLGWHRGSPLHLLVALSPSPGGRRTAHGDTCKHIISICIQQHITVIYRRTVSFIGDWCIILDGISNYFYGGIDNNY